MNHRLLTSTTAAALALSVVAISPVWAQSNADRDDRSRAQQQDAAPAGSKPTDRDKGAASKASNGERAGPSSASPGNQPSQTAPKQRSESATDRGDKSRQDKAEGQRSSGDDRREVKKEKNDQQRSAGQGRDERSPKGEAERRGSGDKAATEKTRTKEDRSRDAQRPRNENTTSATADGGELQTDSSISLSQGQRAQVQQRFTSRVDRMKIRPISRSNLDVSIRIGATLPATLSYHTVPADVVAVYPRFRGYRFVVVEEEIIIVEPSNRRIVAVMPYSTRRARAEGRSTTGAAVSSGRLRLDAGERERIRTIVLQRPLCRQELRFDIVIAIPVPRTVEICEFPQEIVTEVPAVRDYRFLVRQDADEIVIIDPRERRVVEVID